MNYKLLEDIFIAYYEARKNKRNTINSLKFEINFEANLFQLYEDINTGKYEISKSISFINFSPVKREIFAADFRDRIVHHLVFNYINPLFEKSFINDSYSCRENKGTHYGIKRIRRFISQCSTNYTEDCYIMKLDIEGYFMKINRELLSNKVKAVIVANKSCINGDYELLLGLLGKIIFNDPVKNCIVKGKRSDWFGLPKTKSLFYAADGDGLPIGNLTSQLFGNIYLNELDHFIKENLGIKYYGRYVDDFVLLHKSKEYLLLCRDRIKMFLENELMLKLHPNKFYLQHYSKGVQFLGVFIKPYRIYAGKRIKKNFFNTIDEWNTVIDKSSGKLSEEEKQQFRANMNSYLGLLKHYNTKKLRAKMVNINLDRYFLEYFGIDENFHKTVLIK